MSKYIILTIFSVFVTALILITTACDKVEPPYMEDNGGGVVGDTVRTVLFEDFTAHKCVNCPRAHKMLEDLHQLYGDRLIVIAEHVGYFAEPNLAPYEYDFRTNEGTEIDNFFGASAAGLPKGVVNREEINGSYVIDVAEFGPAVLLALDSMPSLPDIYIKLDANYNSTDSTIGVNVNFSALKDMPANKYKIAVFVTESKIISAQLFQETSGSIVDILDYEHNHVLRGSINSTWGEEFADGALTNGQTFTKSYTNYKIGKDWNPDNLHIVAYVYFEGGVNDKIVIQAAQIDLK